MLKFIRLMSLFLTFFALNHFAFAQNFVEVTDEQNPIVNFTIVNSYVGASWVDYDVDGDIDLFLNLRHLFRNEGDGQFSHVENSGIADSATDDPPGMSNAWGDYDNDGDPDLFLAGFRSALYQNMGDGTFQVMSEGDLGLWYEHRGWSCAWADYNNDSFLDIVITHPEGFVPPVNDPTPNHFLHNNGDGSFTELDMYPITGPLAPYTVGSWSDYDLDGDMDLFIGSGPVDGVGAPDHLFKNMIAESNAPVFAPIGTAPIATDIVDGQVWAWIDYDNDGDLDAYLTNYGWTGSDDLKRNRLYRNDGGSYTPITTGAIVEDADISLGQTWADFDNDGDLDCYVANEPGTNRYYKNNGDGTFTSETNPAVISGNQRCPIAGDYDNDGDLDLFVSGSGTSHGLFRNDLDNGYGWLKITCEGTSSNRSAIGTKVRAKADLMGVPTWQMREVGAQNSFNGHNSLIVHFGLADAAVVDSLVLQWPSGEETVLTDVSINQHLTITEGEALSVEDSTTATLARLHQNYPNPFNPSTTIQFSLARDSRVIVDIYNSAGQAVKRLAEGQRSAGDHVLVWDGTNHVGEPVTSGIYFYRLKTENFSATRSMVLVK